MKGQWVGEYTGSNNGEIILNLEMKNNIYQAEAFIHPSDLKLPSTVAYFQAPNENNSLVEQVYFNAVDPETG